MKKAAHQQQRRMYCAVAINWCGDKAPMTEKENKKIRRRSFTTPSCLRNVRRTMSFTTGQQKLLLLLLRQQQQLLLILLQHGLENIEKEIERERERNNHFKETIFYTSYLTYTQYIYIYKFCCALLIIRKRRQREGT